jgi:hypothetical protein
MQMRVLVVVILELAAGTEVYGEGGQQPTLRVQAVDVAWLPLPGLRVRVIQVTGCKRGTQRRGKPLVENTDRDGNAAFQVADNRAYLILVGGERGFEKAEQCVELGRHPLDHPTAYVQLRVAVVVPRQ